MIDLEEDEPPDLAKANELESEAPSAITVKVKGLELTKVALIVVTGIVFKSAHRSSVAKENFKLAKYAINNADLAVTLVHISSLRYLQRHLNISNEKPSGLEFSAEPHTHQYSALFLFIFCKSHREKEELFSGKDSTLAIDFQKLMVLIYDHEEVQESCIS